MRLPADRRARRSQRFEQSLKVWGWRFTQKRLAFVFGLTTRPRDTTCDFPPDFGSISQSFLYGVRSRTITQSLCEWSSCAGLHDALVCGEFAVTALAWWGSCHPSFFSKRYHGAWQRNRSTQNQQKTFPRKLHRKSRSTSRHVVAAVQPHSPHLRQWLEPTSPHRRMRYLKTPQHTHHTRNIKVRLPSATPRS
jgi:hypothetical protein